MKKFIVIVLTFFTFVAIVAYCDQYVHCHMITSYCPVGPSEVVSCTPPGATLAGHDFDVYISYLPYLPPFDPVYDDDRCLGYAASGSEVCSYHAEGGQ